MNTKLIKWDNYGESSLTLLSVIAGLDKKSPAVPLDPSDFKRCVHLFECLNAGEEKISSVLTQTSDKYLIWKPFADNWDKLMYIYNKEKDEFMAPLLYEELKKLRTK